HLDAENVVRKVEVIANDLHVAREINGIDLRYRHWILRIGNIVNLQSAVASDGRSFHGKEQVVAPRSDAGCPRVTRSEARNQRWCLRRRQVVDENGATKSREIEAIGREKVEDGPGRLQPIYRDRLCRVGDIDN